MSRVVALAGTGDSAAPAPLSPRAMVVWSLVVVATLGIFVGTLTLNPGKKRS